VKRFAALTGLGFGELACAGSADSRQLAGTARGWNTANPCLPLHIMRRSNSANPLILADELEKSGGSSRNGDIRQTLLGMLEPVTASDWPDEFLQVGVNLSQVTWLATANTVEQLKGPLLSRFRIVEIGQPSAADFELVLPTILRDIASELQMAVADLPRLEDKAIARLRAAFAAGWPIRRIRAAIEGALQQTRRCRVTH